MSNEFPEHFDTPDDRISIVIPTYNEADNLENIIAESFDALDNVSSLTDVVVVNDASTDQSRSVLERLQRKYPNLCVYHNAKNIGCHPSSLIAWSLAEGDYRLFIPADGQIPPSELSKFLAKAKEGHDVVYSWRSKRQDPIHRIYLSRCYNAIIRLFFGIRLHDANSAALLTANAVERILPNIQSDSAFISVEILLEAIKHDMSIAEVEIAHLPRKNGQAKGINLKDLCMVPVNLVKMMTWCWQRKQRLQK